MRQKLTEEQKYNRKYYLEHKDDKDFKERRSRNAKAYRAKPKVKNRRNAKLREKWANDPEYRQRISEYQKAYRLRKKLAAKKRFPASKSRNTKART